MAQFTAEAAISIVTDDEEDDEDSCDENETYSRAERPEIKSRGDAAARRPMISRSRDSADGQSTDESDGLLLGIIKNGVGYGKCRQNGGSGVAGSDVPTGSGIGGCLLPTAILVILCLLIAAFPVHFPAVFLPGVVLFSDVTLRLSVCLAIVGAITASMTSQLVFKMAAGSLRSENIFFCKRQAGRAACTCTQC